MTAITRELLSAGTSVVADVFDECGLLPPVLDTALAPVTPSTVSFAGPAYTVTGRSEEWEGAGDRAKLQAIDDMTAGVVPVWAGNDIRGVCCFGDLLTEAMKARGVAGVVVDGGVRDVGELKSIGLPIVARYKTPAQAIGRWRVTGHQIRIQVRGAVQDSVTISPGDIVVIDGDGAIVVPQDIAKETAARATEIASTESAAREDIRAGMKLLEALERYGHL